MKTEIITDNTRKRKSTQEEYSDIGQTRGFESQRDSSIRRVSEGLQRRMDISDTTRRE